MKSSKASALHSKVQTLLERRQLHEAFNILSTTLSNISDRKLSDLLKQQEETYKYLIHYLVEGYPDSGRERMLSEIISTLQFINDSILRNEILIDSPDIYSSTLRFERIRKATLSTRLNEYKEARSLVALAEEAGLQSDDISKMDDALLALFNYVWTMYGSSTEDYKLLTDAVTDNDLPFDFKAQIISALFLGNLLFFDRKGAAALFDIFESDVNPKLSARALVSIVLLLAANKESFKRDPQLYARLQLWGDSLVIYRQLREVIMSIIRAHDTQRISSKMQNEVIPELMKLQPEILKRLGKISENADLESLEANPEWEEIVNKNGLGDKLKELTDIQMDGGDVMMVAFSNLKNFPFFNSVANWFLPFTNTHHEVLEACGNSLGAFNEIFDSEGVICDSDKFSFIFSLAKMPEQQRNMVNNQMQVQMNQLKEVMADKRLKSTIPDFDQETTRFTRDIYRFFKLFRKKGDFPDPFIHPLDFISLPVVGDIMSDMEIMNLVGEFYFKRGYYKEALPLLQHIEAGNPEDTLVWEKLGFCYNALGQLDKALEWYKKAELFNPDSQWLIKKIALCSRLLNHFDDAAEYYAKALEKDPENYQLLMNTGHSLLEAGKTEAALGNYYHADYVSPGKPATLRAIAWTELINGNLDKSLSWYNKIMSLPEKNATDCLNIGHVYFLKKDYKKALESYKESAKFEGYGLQKLEEALKEDIPALENAGGEINDLQLLIEKVKYDLK